MTLQAGRRAEELILRLRGRQERMDGRCRIMGIVNLTPDSFSDGGAFPEADAAVRHAVSLVEAGADMLDLGAESTRPGAETVPVAEECRRLLPVLERLRPLVDVPISVDTRKADVASRALEAGADLINDVSALRHDPAMTEVLSRCDTPVVLMHMQGEPATMQEKPRYEDVVEEVLAFFAERIDACRRAGLTQLVLDPGIGFGKRLEDNLALLQQLPRIAELGYPLLVGTSRKSFIGQLTGRSVGDRLGGSIASNVYAALAGANILRVHDVTQVRDAVEVALAIQRHNR